MTPTTHFVTLTCHPQMRTDTVRRVTARVSRLPGGTLELAFALDADLARLRIPPPRAACPTHALWEHTCFETFIALDKSHAYYELNFAPSGEWMIYAFQRYREFASQPDDIRAPTVAVRRSAERIDLDVTLRLGSLSATHVNAGLRLALAAVVEDESGRLSYWALRHPAGKPDFHQSDAFALALAAPGVDSAGDPG